MRLIEAGDLWSDVMMLPHNGDMISSEDVEQAIMNAPVVDALVFPFYVYAINKIQYMAVCKFLETHYFIDTRLIRSINELFFVSKLYDGIFLSREEAEAALAKMDGGSI